MLNTLTKPTRAKSDSSPSATTDHLSDHLKKEELSTKKEQSSDPGKLTYEAALGEFLGGELFKVVSKELSQAKLEKHAKKAIDSALSGVAEWLKGQASPDQAAIAAKFTAQLQEALKGPLQELLAEDMSGISQWTKGNPRTVLAAAIAAAAAFVLSNQKIPELKYKLGLGGGHGLNVGVDLGKTLDISVNKLKAGYSYKSETSKASVEGSADLEKDSWGLKGMASTKTGMGLLSADGSYNAGPDGYDSQLGMALKNKELSARLFGKASEKDGKSLHSLGLDLTHKYSDNGKLSFGGEAGNQGWKAKAGWSFGDEKKKGAWNIGGQVSGMPGAKAAYQIMMGYKLKF